MEAWKRKEKKKVGGEGFRQIIQADLVQDVIKHSPTSTLLGLNCPTYGSVTRPKPKPKPNILCHIGENIIVYA